MKKRMSLAAFGIAAALLVGTMSIGQAWSYFTDTTSATGGIPIKVKPTTDISEEYGGGTKTIHITNDEDSVPVYVRARVFANSDYLDSVGGEGWSAGADGWYYYGEVVQPGEAAASLLVKVSFPEFKTTTTTNPDGTTTVVEEEIDHNGENFNVIVVYEATPGIYGEDGELCAPEAANWAMASEQ